MSDQNKTGKINGNVKQNHKAIYFPTRTVPN